MYIYEAHKGAHEENHIVAKPAYIYIYESTCTRIYE